MAQLNPMLVRLQQKIENYNKDVQRKIDNVANRQKIVTIGVVCFNLIVLFLSNYLLPDDSKDESLRLLSLFSNDQLSILVTVISIGFSVSTATLIGKNSFKELKIDDTIIEPKLQYAGEWEYLTEFRIQTKDDGSTEYQRFKDNMEDYKERGISYWTQDAFELKIDFGNTSSSNEKKVETQTMPAGDNTSSDSKSKKKKPQVNWQSNPIAYDEHKVSWSFNGTIWWNDDKNYANEFSGIELYYVRGTDSQDRPSLLEGRLIGTILVGDKFFVVDAISKFWRK